MLRSQRSSTRERNCVVALLRSPRLRAEVTKPGSGTQVTSSCAFLQDPR